MVGRGVRAPTSSFRDVLVLRDSTSFPYKNLSRPPLLKAHPAAAPRPLQYTKQSPQPSLTIIKSLTCEHSTVSFFDTPPHTQLQQCQRLELISVQRIRALVSSAMTASKSLPMTRVTAQHPRSLPSPTQSASSVTPRRTRSP